MNCKNNSDNKRLSIMKKVLAIVIALLPFITMGQTIVSLGTIGDEEVYVVMKKNSNKPDKVRIPMQIAKSEGSAATLDIKIKDISKFRGVIFEARMKYKEWCKIAEENNVGDFSKDLPVNFFWIDGTWRFGDWQWGQTKPHMVFYKENGLCKVRMSAYVQAFGNRYINTTMVRYFVTDYSFDVLLDILSHDNIQQKLADQSNYDLEKKESNVNYDKLFN